MHVVCQGFVTQRVALLGARRNIDYVGRKNYRNAYSITSLDVASDHRSRLARRRWSGSWLECLFEARCHSTVGRHAVENYATGCTARHVLPEGPPCARRKGQHGSTRRPKVVTGKLKITQGQLKKARDESAKLNDATTQKLTALDTSVHSELATKATSDDVKVVDTKVVGVKTDLDATREDLKMARSEMGTLIARNHDEIDQLRRLGERDYVEFTITGKNKPAKVSNVTVELKGVNEKRNQVSIAMTVEDKRFEKKNRALNEPSVFYLPGTHIPEQVVINKVGKNTISGYLSIPKANSQTAAAATKSGN